MWQRGRHASIGAGAGDGGERDVVHSSDPEKDKEKDATAAVSVFVSGRVRSGARAWSASSTSVTSKSNEAKGAWPRPVQRRVKYY